MSNQILLKRSSTANAIPTTANIALGELAINTADGNLFTKIDNGVATIVNLTQNQTITLTGDVTGSGQTAISTTLANSGVTAGTYGSATSIPSVTVDDKGRVTSVSNNAVSFNPSSISNGTSNVNIATSGGNVTIGVDGTSNVAVFDATGEFITGLLSVTGNITGGNVSATNYTGTDVSVTGTTTAASTVGGVITGSSASVTGTQTAASTVGGVITGSSVSVTGGVDATSVAGGVITGTSVSVTGGVTAASVAGGVITGTNTSVTGAQTAASTVGGVITGSSVSVTGNVNATDTNSNVYGTTVSASGTVTAASTVGGVITGSSTSVTGTQTAASTVGGIIEGSSISVTGNVTGGNLVSATVTNATALTVSTNAGNINIEPAGNVVVNNTYINGALNPVQNQDVATKIYVDNMTSTAISYHEAVVATTNTTLETATGGTVTYDQPNGAANGVGATLTTTGSFDLIDTANVQTVGTRILVKDQANAVQNGVYVWSNATTITRSSDADTAGKGAFVLGLNDYFFTTSGNVNAGSAFIVDAPLDTIIFGTSEIEFAQFSSSQTYTANTSAGLSLVGTVFSAKVDNNTTAFDGLGNISVKAGANLTTPNIGEATGSSLSVTGTVTAASTVGGVITGSSVSATGGVDATSVAGGVITGTSTSVTGTQTAASTVGGVITGSSVSVTGAQTAASTVGGVITGSSVSVTGNVDANSFNGNVFGTTVSATGNITGGNLVTSGAGGGISGSGNITGGNILTAGDVSATGNVAGNYFFGNGSQLTGVAATTATALTNGNTNVTTALNGNTSITIAGTSNVAVFADTGEFITGLLSVTGNVTGDYFIGNGSQLTGINTGVQSSIANGTSNVVVDNSANVTVSSAGTANVLTVSDTGAYVTGVVSATGNVVAGNIVTAGSAGELSGTGNIVAGNVRTSGQVSALGNITGGNLITTGNITGGNILTAGAVSATGNITTANSFVGNLVGTTVSVESTVGGIITGSSVSVSGAVTAGNVNATNFNGGTLFNMTLGSPLRTNGYQIQGGSFDYSQINVGFNSGGDQGIAINSFGNAAVQINTGNAGANTYNWTFTADTGAFNAPGAISATGNITGGNVFGTGVFKGGVTVLNANDTVDGGTY